MWKRNESLTSSGAATDQPAKPREIDRNSSPTGTVDVGKSVTIKGELSGFEDLTVNGQMEGSIKLPGHTLTIGPRAAVKAEMSAKAVVIMGAVIGNVMAEDKVEISETGKLTGDIVSPRLSIADHGFFLGKVEMSPKVIPHAR